MLTALHIKNFRCFRDERVAGLSRINLVVGPNGSGKTAFLEALSLLTGPGPQQAIAIRQYRGLADSIAAIPDIESFKAVWSDMFHHFDGDSSIHLSTEDSERGSRQLEITFSQQPVVLPPPGGEVRGLAPPLNFVYKFGEEKAEVVPLQISDKGLLLGTPRHSTPGAYFPSSHPVSSRAVQLYSQLMKENLEQEVLQAVQERFPQIGSLSIAMQSPVWGPPLLYAYLPSIPERKIPLELVSSGISKFVALLLAIITVKKGVVLVDEIDNGLYYDQFPDIHRSLLRFCEKYDVQIFASTHSMEFIRASGAVESENAYCLLRSEKRNGVCEIRGFSGKDLRSAIDQGVDVR